MGISTKPTKGRAGLPRDSVIGMHLRRVNEIIYERRHEREPMLNLAQYFSIASGSRVLLEDLG